MNPRLIFAVDPGSTTCGYVAVFGDGARVRFVQAGTMAAVGSAFCSTVLGVESRTSTKVSLLAIEQPAGFVFEAARGAHLLATAAAAGGLAWLGESLGFEVARLTAVQVRTMLLGKARIGFRQRKGDMDRIVKSALPPFVFDMPKQSNAHVRDALALAVVANWIAQGRRAA